MNEADYIDRFAKALAGDAGIERHRHHDSFARSHYNALTCDPEQDAIEWRKSLEVDHDPIKTLTDKYHADLRELLLAEVREEIRSSI
jgi:hypothetical protein